jgi:hypothetical protein
MVLADSRACALSVMPGNRRRSSTAAELATLFEHGADCSGIRLGDHEHRGSMGRLGMAGNCFRIGWLLAIAMRRMAVSLAQRRYRPETEGLRSLETGPPSRAGRQAAASRAGATSGAASTA